MQNHNVRQEGYGRRCGGMWRPRLAHVTTGCRAVGTMADFSIALDEFAFRQFGELRGRYLSDLRGR